MVTLLLALLLTADVGPPGPAPEATPLTRGGRFSKGLSLELPELGVFQAIGPGGVTTGVATGVAFQLDLGPRLALRFPVRLNLAAFGGLATSYTDLVFAPGALYRFRYDVSQRWVPYTGAGVRLGAFSAGRSLLGHGLATTTSPLEAAGSALFDFDDHDSSSSGGSPDLETKLGAGLELLAGLEWHPSRWFVMNIGLVYGYVRMFGVGVHTVRETVGARLIL
ncbi:MAG: hypothetical protein ACYC8T_21975 [Myxococcaceae bacterium]